MAITRRPAANVHDDGALAIMKKPVANTIDDDGAEADDNRMVLGEDSSSYCMYSVCINIHIYIYI